MGKSNNIYDKLFSLLEDNDIFEPQSDSLEGVEELDSEEKRKIIDQMCQNFLTNRSILLNNKNNTIMNTTKLTQDELNTVVARYNEINSTMDAATSLKDGLIAYYLKEVEDPTLAEATHTVERLMSGVEDLTAKYRQALDQGWNPESEVEQMTADMTVEQRYNFLVNAIAIVKSINAKNLGQTGEQVTELVESSIATMSQDDAVIDDQVCQTLTQTLSALLESPTVMLNSAEQVQELMRAAGEGQTEAVDFAAQIYDDNRYKCQMALAAWIEYQQGNLESFPEHSIPEAVGVSVAAAVEEAKIIEEVSLGRKTVEWGVMCLKVLGGVALACLLGYIALLGIAISTMAFFEAGIMVLGTTTAAIIGAGMFAVLVSCGVSQTAIEAGAKVMVWCGDVFDQIVETLRDRVFPVIRNIASKLVSKIKILFTKQGQDATAGATN